MSLGTIKETVRRKWLSISNGKVELSENGAKLSYSFVEGKVTAVYKRKRNFHGEEVDRWFIDIKDEEGGLYSISFPYSSGIFKSIILALASIDRMASDTVVRITPYMKGDYTKVIVTANGQKLDWITSELPPVEEVTVGDKVFKDSSKRMEYIEGLADSVNRRAEKAAF